MADVYIDEIHSSVVRDHSGGCGGNRLSRGSKPRGTPKAKRLIYSQVQLAAMRTAEDLVVVALVGQQGRRDSNSRHTVLETVALT